MQDAIWRRGNLVLIICHHAHELEFQKQEPNVFNSGLHAPKMDFAVLQNFLASSIFLSWTILNLLVVCLHMSWYVKSDDTLFPLWYRMVMECLCASGPSPWDQEFGQPGREPIEVKSKSLNKSRSNDSNNSNVQKRFDLDYFSEYENTQ